MKKLALFYICLACLGLLVPGDADASYLTIFGRSQLEVILEGDQIRVSGSYFIENRGDETAQNVYPVIRLGQWSWAGEPRLINANQEADWVLNELFPLNKLECAANDACAGQTLHISGRLPMFVIHHYQDMNGYEFSAPKVDMMQMGEVSGEALVGIRSPALKAVFVMEGDGAEFEGELSIQNSSAELLEVSLSYFSTRELQLKTMPSVVSVSPGGVESVAMEAANFSGRAGSSYPVFAVLQWNQHGVRNTASAFASAMIEEPEKGYGYIYGIVGVLALSLLTLFFVVFRRRSES